MQKISVLIVARNQADCDAVRDVLEGQPEWTLTSRVDAAADPLQGLAAPPDLLVLVLGADGENALRLLAARPAHQRPAVIAVGPAGESQLMRRAMQAGARDYFTLPVPRGELLQAARLIARERAAGTGRRRSDSDRTASAPGPLTAVINAKGGSGASFIACNLAHAAALRREVPVALVDLDLQFGALPAALDLEQRNTLLEALAAADQLDGVALQGYMGKHASGVHVLSAMSDQMPLPWEIRADALMRLMTLVRQTYAEAIVDLPRQIDPLTGVVLAQATRVVIVMQQSLAHIRDAKRMLRVLTTSLGVPRDHVVLVVNRHSEQDSVGLKDIEETVKPPALLALPSDFRAVSESLNAGVPIADFDRNAPVTQALQALAAHLDGGAAPSPAGNGRKRTLREALLSGLTRP